MTASLRLRFIAAAIGVAGGLNVAAASAEEPVETAIRQWVSQLDASPSWVAGFSDISYDAGSQTATIHNLAIRSETLATKVEITFGTISVAGYNATGNGGFSATAIKADSSRLVVGNLYDMKLADMSAQNIGVPGFASFTFDPAHAVSSVVAAYAIMAQGSADAMHIGSIDIDQTVDDQKSHASFGTYDLKNWKNGIIDLVTIGPLVEETPSQDGLLKMKIERIEARKYDLNALVDVFDPSRYANGVGDGRWRTALALETYKNLSFAIPGAEVRIGGFEAENLKVRQPPKSFTPFLDQLIANPNMPPEEQGKLAIENLPNLMTWLGFGAFRVSDVDVVAPDVERFHLGDFHITDLSSDGLGEFGIGDLTASIVDKGSFSAERLAVGGFTFPSVDRIAAAIQMSQAGMPSEGLPPTPTMGFAEAVNVSMIEGDHPIAAVDRARLDLSSYVGAVPTEVGVDIRGINIDRSLIDDAKAKKMLEQLGYQSLQADYGFKLAWREADESVRVSNFKLAIKDVGNFAADLMLTGLKRSMIENPKTIRDALPDLLFQSGKFVIEDKSITDRAIGMEAAKKKQTAQKYKQDLVGALPFSLMLVLKNPGFQAKLAPALQQFINSPGTMTIIAAPASPVPVVKLIEAAQSNPRSLPDLLSLDISTSK